MSGYGVVEDVVAVAAAESRLQTATARHFRKQFVTEIGIAGYAGSVSRKTRQRPPTTGYLW